jgi:hypothetical protein
MSNIHVFEYNGQKVEFEMAGNNVMVNATEMAKIFNDKVANFYRSDSTKLFINAIKSSHFRVNLNLKSDEDLIQSKGRNGTWMHRVLALKFAAWLNPEFEVWVYLTIDKLLFGEAIERKQLIHDSIRLKNEIAAIEQDLANIPEFKLWSEKRAELMRLGKDLKANDKAESDKQLELFITA